MVLWIVTYATSLADHQLKLLQQHLESRIEGTSKSTVALVVSFQVVVALGIVFAVNRRKTAAVDGYVLVLALVVEIHLTGTPDVDFRVITVRTHA